MCSSQLTEDGEMDGVIFRISVHILKRNLLKLSHRQTQKKKKKHAKKTGNIEKGAYDIYDQTESKRC